MGQTQSRTADFAGVLPSRASARPSAAANAIQPQPAQQQLPQPAAVSTTAKPTAAVAQLDQLPAHCIAVSGGGISSSSSSLKAAPRPDAVATALWTPRRGVADADDRGVASATAAASQFVEPESVRKARVLDAHADVCSEVLDGLLFVSSLRVALDRAVLDALGISHVVDCCAELTDADARSDDGGRVRLRLALRDDTYEDLSPFLLFQLVPLLAQCRREQRPSGGPKLLVHCHQGVSRSCAVAIALVMADRALPFHEAAALVKQRRAVSSPNAAFLCQLIHWGRHLDALRAGARGPRVLAGLFRLAPHADHDPRTLVLKKCGGGGDRDLEVDIVATELWAQGVFVFQRPSDATVVVWTGAKCGIQGGAAIARRFVENAARAKAFAVSRAEGASPTRDGDGQVQIVDECGQEGDDGGRYEYASELQWYLDAYATTSIARQELAVDVCQEPLHAVRAVGGGSVEAEASEPTMEKRVATPLLFVLEALESDESGAGTWDLLKQYDAEDLAPQDAFLLLWTPPTTADTRRRLECFVWIGADCSWDAQRVVSASRRHLATVVPTLATSENEADRSLNVAVERQNRESDRFWHAFELGY